MKEYVVSVTGFALEFSHTGTVVCVCIAYHTPGVE